MLDSWLTASGAGVTQRRSQLGGKTVTRIDYGADGAKDYVVTRDGATIVITTADEDLATAAIGRCPSLANLGPPALDHDARSR